ncbi:carbohydrate kinase family protein [Candidatus Parvarchaeota archaeon]|nr:carbohydrate kinase family protein [Candidatus Parvarchaeota archaeon]
MFDVISLGSATKDIFLFMNKTELKPGINKHFLEIPFDKKIEIKNVLSYTGGSATNSAATFTKCGKKTAFISAVGSDDDSEFLLKDMVSRGISTDYAVRLDGPTPITTILVSSNNHMVVLVYRGIENMLRLEDIRLDFKSKWMYIGALPKDSYEALPSVIKYCNENDIKIAFNPGSFELEMKIKKLEPILKYIDIISMNNDEAKSFVGYGNDTKNVIKLASSVKQAAIITKGRNGSIVADKKYIYYADTFKTKQINFIGAGDAYFSGFVTMLYEGKSIEEAITFGSFNASSVVKVYGGKEGITSEYPEQKLKIRRVKYEKD